MTSIPRLLFVCTGNLHRSVMAELLTRAMFDELGHPIHTASAGTLGLNGVSSPKEVVTACAELGVDASGHRSQGLHRALVENADLIIVMEQAHAEAVINLSPGAEGRIIHLADYTDGGPEIDDPIGGQIERFVEVRDTILHGLQNVLPTLIQRLHIKV